MRRLLPAALAATLLTLAACSSPDRTPTAPTATTSATAAAAAGTASCSPAATASYKPVSSLPAGAIEKTIAQRGRLVVGVSSDTRLLGARNLSTNAFEGFDIEVARRVAQAILGSPDKIQFKAISAAQRVPFLKDGTVDIVARAMTMTCDRWKDVSFAGPYFTSYLKVLVLENSTATSLKTVKGKVCATSGSTTLAKVAATVGSANAVGVPLTTDCMVLWQQGQVAAIAADDAILAGLAAQDPSAKIVGDQTLEQEPYGLAVSKDHPEFAQFVNGVLDRMRTDGGWQDAYQASKLKDFLPGRSQPRADYTRPLP